MTTPNNTVAGLAEKWREAADDAARTIGIDKTARALALIQCADELEAALASPAPSAPVVDDAMVERACEGYLQEAKRQGFAPSEAWARSQQAKDWMRAALTAALSGVSAPVGVDEVEYEFEVWQDDAMQAGGSTTDYATAKAEADHYALMYGQDGPVEVRMYEKRQIIAALAGKDGA